MLPDSPPDSGSEAYSPQQVNGESRPRPPPCVDWLVGAALSEGGGRRGGGPGLPNCEIITSQILSGLAIGPGYCFPTLAGGEWAPVSSQCPHRGCHPPNHGAIMDSPFGGKWLRAMPSGRTGAQRPPGGRAQNDLVAEWIGRAVYLTQHAWNACQEQGATASPEDWPRSWAPGVLWCWGPPEEGRGGLGVQVLALPTWGMRHGQGRLRVSPGPVAKSSRLA